MSGQVIEYGVRWVTVSAVIITFIVCVLRRNR